MTLARPPAEAGGAARRPLPGVAEEQASLRRVATLVGACGSPEDIFRAVSDEIRRLIGIDVTSMFRLEADETLTLLAVQTTTGPALDGVVGRRIPMGGEFRRLLAGGAPRRLDAVQVAHWIKDLPEAGALQLRASIGMPIVVGGQPWGAVFASACDADALAPEVEAPFARFTELVAIAIGTAQARSDLSMLARQQTALRRVATLVISGADADAIFATVAREVAPIVDADLTGLSQRLPEGGSARIAVWSADTWLVPGDPHRADEPWLDPALQAGRPVRCVLGAGAPPGSLAGRIYERGGRSLLATPIVVDGRTWGAIFAVSRAPEPFAADAEERMMEFTELVATAITAAATRAELAASNERLVESQARVVAAADDERARVARDLHDGAQQRLVHTLMALKLAQRAMSAGGAGAEELVDDALTQATRAQASLRELAHGIMPSVLAHGGLRAGVGSLLNDIPIDVDAEVLAERLPAHIEASAYFIVAEALTNILKHAGAQRAGIRAVSDGRALTVEVCDDGVGGAQPGQRTGLLGLQDRAVALNGSLRVHSPVGAGTVITAVLPLDAADQSATYPVTPDGLPPASS